MPALKSSKSFPDRYSPESEMVRESEENAERLRIDNLGFRVGEFLYHVHGLPVAEDEIYGALYETVFEVMAAGVITKRVLPSVESAVVESRLVARNSKCCPLSSNCSRWWHLCGVL